MGVTITASQFIFNGINSSEYKLELLTDEGNLQDSKGITVTPTLIKTTYGDKYRCQGYELDGSIQFSIKMGTRERMSAKEQSDIQHWLFNCGGDFKRLEFIQDDLDGLHFMAKATEFKVIQVGNMPYLCEVTFTCDSYYAYEEEATETYNLSGTTNTIKFDNKSQQNSLMFPLIEFKTRSGGNVSISNITDGDRSLSFDELIANETIKVDCYDGMIESSTDLNRLSNCKSKKLTRLYYGVNDLKITGDITYLKITYKNARIIAM